MLHNMEEGATRQALPTRIGRYDVVGHIATGGMAELFLGIEPPEAKPVAIKRILPHLARQASFVTMFLDEARIGSLVRHPSLVDVYELGQVTGDLFLVMEYLQGENLANVIRRLLKRRERIAYALAAHIIREAAIALAAAHDLGVVHRDVSPQNVFVTYEGDVKVLDFGIATAVQRLSHTEAGQLKGKFSYMSPEQSRGEPLDGRSDVFALGIVLYELSMQHTLFRRPSELMVLKAVCEEPIPRPTRDRADYPRRLEEVCLRALSRDRDARYQSMADFADALAPLAALDEPRAELRLEMDRLFDDRRDEKSQMLRRARARSSFDDFGSLPSSDVDELVEMPQISIAPDEPPPPAETTARWRWGIAAAAALAIGAGALIATSPRDIVAQLPDLPRKPPQVAPQIAAAPHEAAPVPAPIDMVSLHIATTPTGATVVLDGIERGPTPVELRLPRADASVPLELHRTGFVAIARELPLDRDQDLSLALAPVKAKPTPRPKQFKRFK